MEMDLVFNDHKGTWNLIKDGEWYAEGSYEQMQEYYDNCIMAEIEAEQERCPEPSDDYYGYIED